MSVKHDEYVRWSFGSEAFIVKVNVSTQHDLQLISEGSPEVEDYEYTFYEPANLRELVDQALKAVASYHRTARQVQVLEDMDLTYADVHRLLTHEEPTFEGLSKFSADEDLMFVHGRLHDLYRFIFEARMALVEADS